MYDGLSISFKSVACKTVQHIEIIPRTVRLAVRFSKKLRCKSY